MSASFSGRVNRGLREEFGDEEIVVPDHAAAGMVGRVQLEMQAIQYPAPTPVRRRGIRRWQAVAVMLLLIVIGLGILVKDFVPRHSHLIGPTPVYAAVVANQPSLLAVETPDTSVPAPAPAVSATAWNDNDDVPHGRPIDEARTDWLITQSNAQHWANEGLSGLDLAFASNSFGSPLHATLRGIVGTLKDRGDGTGYGNAVYTLGFVSPSGLSYNTVMGHFQKLYVTDGQQVARGTVLGEMGSTGWSTGPHVHYEVWQCQMTADEVQRGIAPGTTNPSHSECAAKDPQAFIGE